ncbi:serine/threonine-protein kinase [Nonomuraea sp. NPDC059194]|uniref:serine/threonine-protein kinase n=1 Tax=Nonomuraea sp. NPDC059194 TaxID=3346764 RepID=UPI0036803665
MPKITGLQRGDPVEVGGFRLTGRLSENVLVGQSASAQTVVVSLLPAELDRDRFLSEVEPLRAVSAVSTAQILETGVLDDRAYVVSEFVEGPTLEQVGGTFDGVTLYRLAAGTITSLVALHQAGFVHGDIRPGNVVLGPDGPRVINVGVARALSQATTATLKVVSPAYTAPERLRGGAAEPPADVFSWAATLVFAASGRSPFDGGSLPATVDRITGGDPDLPDLGELHGLLAACLAKDPHMRPTASEVLLRLVGQTSYLSGLIAPATPPVRQPPLTPAGRLTGAAYC